MNIRVFSYQPKFHVRLLSFMRHVYPNRSDRYLDWWLTNIDNSGKDCWDKCIIVFDGDAIIGCTTVNEVDIKNGKGEKRLYAQANTILLADYRGKGISRKIYEKYNYPDWITLGFTDIAWKIQPRYVKNFTPINPVNVYVSFNVWGFIKRHIWRILRRTTMKECEFPSYINWGGGQELVLIKDLNEIPFPKDGKWNEDDFEIVRDKTYFQKRFLDIYCSEKYHIYVFMVSGKVVGYVVLRNTVYKELDMVSLVDFRFCKRKDEIKGLKAATKVAGLCGIGIVITLTSRNWGHRLSPLTFLTKKKLYGAVGMKDYTEKFNEMLVTSADSDLDFVYYK